MVNVDDGSELPIELTAMTRMSYVVNGFRSVMKIWLVPDPISELEYVDDVHNSIGREF